MESCLVWEAESALTDGAQIGDWSPHLSSPVLPSLPESSKNVGLSYGGWDNAHSSDFRDKDQLAVFQAAYSWAKA